MLLALARAHARVKRSRTKIKQAPPDWGKVCKGKDHVKVQHMTKATVTHHVGVHLQVVVKGTCKGTLEITFQITFQGTFKGILEMTFQGTFEGTFKGTCH